MIDLKDILVATDFSMWSEAAVEQASALAETFGANLHVLHVVTKPLHDVSTSYAPAAGVFHLVRDLEHDARERLAALPVVGALGLSRVIVSTAWGDPSDEILKYARVKHVGLVVCGTHGRRGWDHALMGSVAERVLRLAPCPVLTARPMNMEGAHDHHDHRY
jgi:universal stress protein A